MHLPRNKRKKREKGLKKRPNVRQKKSLQKRNERRKRNRLPRRKKEKERRWPKSMQKKPRKTNHNQKKMLTFLVNQLMKRNKTRNLISQNLMTLKLLQLYMNTKMLTTLFKIWV